jgi:DNA polymerase alpha-associated DNA helicase A
VIVSLVRSNPEHEVGFLGEKRRLNGQSELLKLSAVNVVNVSARANCRIKLP